MSLSFLMAVHIAGGLLWLGGAAAAIRVILERKKADIVAERAFPGLERRFLYWAALPGFAATAAAGAVLTGYNRAYFTLQGWFLAKSAALLCAAAATAYLFHVAAGERWRAAPPAALGSAAWLLGLSGTAALVLSTVRPF